MNTLRALATFCYKEGAAVMVVYDDTVLERFWSYVEKTAGCWLWRGPTTRGYGALTVPLGSHGASHRSNHVGAHRFSFLFHIGPIPDRLYVLHDCPGGDNKACVNPAHLWLGTHGDNVRDAVGKGRHSSITHPELIRRGDRHWSKSHPDRVARGKSHGSQTHPEALMRGTAHYKAKLDDEQIRDIRRRVEGIQGTRALRLQLAQELGVTPECIYNIVTRKNQRHVPD
jgi:hypothetical protein